MHLPAWFRSDSGLLLPSSLGRPTPSVGEIPSELLPSAQPVAVASSPPTFMDQVAVYGDEAAAGLPTSSLEQVKAWAAQVPFEAGIAMVAVIAAKAFGMRGDQVAQLAFARELYGEDLSSTP